MHQLQQRMQAGRLESVPSRRMAGATPSGLCRRTRRQIAARSRRAGPAGRCGWSWSDSRPWGASAASCATCDSTGSSCRCAPWVGRERGQLQWHPPHRETLRQLVRNPAYAGAYTWGRYATDPRRARPGRRGSGRVRRAARGLPGVPARQSPRVPELGAIPDQPPPPGATPQARPGPRPGADDGGGPGRAGGVRRVRLPHADTLHTNSALCVPAAGAGLRGAALSELGRRGVGGVGA